MLKTPVPHDVKSLLENHQLNGIPFLLSTKSDLSLAGDVAPHWVVATQENVAVVADGAEPRLVTHFPLSRVQKFRAQGTIGSGFLQAYVDQSWVDVARYSNTLATRFHKLAGKLEDLRSNGDVEVDPAEQVDSAHCQKCGLTLPPATESCPRCLPRRAIMSRLWQLLRPRWPAALGMCGLMLIGVVMELAPPKLQQYLVDEILTKGEAAPNAPSLLSALLLVVLALAATRVLLGIVNWLKGLLSNKVGHDLTFDIRDQLVQKLHSLGVGYYDRHQVGSLVSRVAHDSEALHGLLQQITGGFLLQIVQVVAVGVMLFTINAKLALYTLIPAPLVVAGSLFFWRRVYPHYYRWRDSSSKQAGMLSGMLSGVRVVKAFAQEPREFERFRHSSNYLRTSRERVEQSSDSFAAVMGLVFSLGGLIVWYVGGRDVLAGEMTLGSLMAFLAYLAMFYAPLSTLSQLTTWLTSFMTGCQHVFELLDTPVDAQEPADPKRLEKVQGEVRFENVTFGYDRHQPVLKNVDFAIRPGEKIGIVGRSGSGKTTLVNLISRFYDVDSGRVTLDGINVRDLATSDLRRNVGIVLQEPFLFRGTICDNLVYGRPEARPEEAVAAARAAQAHDFILRAPLAYDTWLGERGAGLSGGERQRVSIARALLYDPKVLILDEATSSVDAESERAIQQALRHLTRGRTTLAIAHRLSTLREADRIFVFDQGRLIEQGPHHELMRLDGQYANLVKLQTQISNTLKVDLLANGTADPAIGDVSDVAAGDDAEEEVEFTPRWLEPGSAELRRGPFDTLELVLPDGETHRGVTAVSCFPATRPNDFISLRVSDLDGEEREVGIARHLDQWPDECQALLRAAMAKRYYIRRVTAIDDIRLEYGYLNFRVQTDQGPGQFTMRWSQSQAQDFGTNGKVLLDLEDNRYLVPDVENLPRRDRELLLRFIYW